MRCKGRHRSAGADPPADPKNPRGSPTPWNPPRLTAALLADELDEGQLLIHLRENASPPAKPGRVGPTALPDGIRPLRAGLHFASNVRPRRIDRALRPSLRKRASWYRLMNPLPR